MSVDLFGHYLKRKHDCHAARPATAFKVSENGDYDMEQHRVGNVKDPQEESDTVTLGFLDAQTDATIKYIDGKVEDLSVDLEKKMAALSLKMDDIASTLGRVEPILIKFFGEK